VWDVVALELVVKWDAVEREFLILSEQLRKVSLSFGALAGELARERQQRNPRGYDSDAASGQLKLGEGAEPPCPFD